MLRRTDASPPRSTSPVALDDSPAVSMLRIFSAPLKVAVSHQPAAAMMWSRVGQTVFTDPDSVATSSVS